MAIYDCYNESETKTYHVSWTFHNFKCNYKWIKNMCCYFGKITNFRVLTVTLLCVEVHHITTWTQVFYSLLIHWHLKWCIYGNFPVTQRTWVWGRIIYKNGHRMVIKMWMCLQRHLWWKKTGSNTSSPLISSSILEISKTWPWPYISIGSSFFIG